MGCPAARLASHIFAAARDEALRRLNWRKGEIGEGANTKFAAPGCHRRNRRRHHSGTHTRSANFPFRRNLLGSRINIEHKAYAKNTSGDAFGVPRLCCLLRCLLTSSLLFSWLPSSLASLLLLSWLPFFYSPFVESTSNTARDTLQLTNV
jgi:hypothetical protein